MCSEFHLYDEQRSVGGFVLFWNPKHMVSYFLYSRLTDAHGDFTKAPKKLIKHHRKAIV